MKRNLTSTVSRISTLGPSTITCVKGLLSLFAHLVGGEERRGRCTDD